jgi:hypothetical protein
MKASICIPENAFKTFQSLMYSLINYAMYSTSNGPKTLGLFSDYKQTLELNEYLELEIFKYSR